MQKPNGQGHWEIVELLASAAHTQETNSRGASVDVGDWDKAIIILDITASATDAGDTLDVYVDISWDGGTNWYNAIHFTQQAGNASAKVEMASLNAAVANAPGGDLQINANAASGVVRASMCGPLISVRSTVARVTGTDESHTFSVFGYFQ
jgi:hypothetical protein